MPRLSDRALVVHLFAPSTGPNSEQAHESLAGIWTACAERLAMTEAIPSSGVPAKPPDDNRRTLGPVAARCCPGPAIQQAMWVREHGVDCVSVALARPKPDALTWTQLRTAWAQATADIGIEALIVGVRMRHHARQHAARRIV